MASGIVSIKVNGRAEEVIAGAVTTLQDVLRNNLDYTSVKDGCSQGGCGACSVIVDGELRLSCLTPVQGVDGSEVVTLEGLNLSNSITALQQKFIEKYAAQCGFCTPGMMVAITALLDRNANPSRDEIAEALAGNICRCTGYLPIIEAVESVVAEMAGTAGD
ncbi:MAG TPA: (2Fe-2S)-binding protein [Alphaproteobacteria bacterium]|jgi:carbon-monoxide dehydrogenase small subunit|nr:(2Fe-2S)-binding protein [Alphaproteobacteria bacterium]HJN60701.1 (2Fe-2S)-binding protein [Alphaproteobacteria bacterium]